VNNRLVEEMTLENRRITVRDTASNSKLSVRGVEAINHEHLWFVPVSTAEKHIPRLNSDL
jgi:hypothetical protein